MDHLSKIIIIAKPPHTSPQTHLLALTNRLSTQYHRLVTHPVRRSPSRTVELCTASSEGTSALSPLQSLPNQLLQFSTRCVVHFFGHIQSNSLAPRLKLSNQLLILTHVPGSVLTSDLEQGSQESPAFASETLDCLYGSYVSELCLTSFLQIMEKLSTPYQQMSSSHRCLDEENQPRVVEVTMGPPPNPEYLSFEDMRKHENIWKFEQEWNVEVVLQKESVFRRHKRLAVFDMDSTLIQEEVIDEIARFIGLEKEVSVRPASILIIP